ncbi:hypothetical protein H2198_001562 [Neophaeococcomyces mojaviensis]|uniref:Uncharacterized protein n=1 Tax=Neophaeococcomyces mojaviensis TaxID=3383035 RepID=A0ACC3AH09_9EURO|nr:hypothetical protein H2198_001562 [Knufia sp. JES_112]
MSSAPKQGATVSSPRTTKAPTQCPYHTAILDLTKFPSDDLRGNNVMTRFLSEGPDEHPAILNRSDNNKTSIDKGCTCADKADRSACKL